MRLEGSAPPLRPWLRLPAQSAESGVGCEVALPNWLLALDWLIRLVALLWIPTRTTPGAARSWLLLVGFVPLLGLPLYLLLGHPWRRARCR
ncbi:hypothetical protein NB693_20560 [Pantoea ananatis]|uniref:hypothetical protein n=1 Tax=Pantoea ananas TaxID=553 RepID=UPI00221FC6C2|nr:hypothetical protein [Pantoea ananatis]